MEVVCLILGPMTTVLSDNYIRIIKNIFNKNERCRDVKTQNITFNVRKTQN